MQATCLCFRMVLIEKMQFSSQGTLSQVERVNRGVPGLRFKPFQTVSKVCSSEAFDVPVMILPAPAGSLIRFACS